MHKTIMDILISRVARLVEKWIGITLSTPSRRIYQFLTQRAQQLALPSAGHYVDILEKASPHDPEVTLIINLVTNGLTAFWRDEPQLDAIRMVLEQLRTERDLEQDPITIWCAGCSTGEEAYTLAMIAHEANIPTTIIGSDINTESLHAAMHGVYHSWSLRRLSPQRQAHYFDELDTDYFAIKTHLRTLVSFQKHNLIAPAPDSPGRFDWDIIVCRNVLIYFNKDAVRQLIQKFAISLHVDGYLMLGSSEHMNAYFDDEHSPFRAARHGAGFVYRLASKPPGTTVYKVPLIRDSSPSFPTYFDDHELQEPSESTLEVPSKDVVTNLIKTGCKHINSNPEQSISCLEAAISYDPFVTDAYFVLASIFIKEAPHQAMDLLRKVLFLKPLHWLAAYSLAVLHNADGAPLRARSLCRQALEGLTSDSPLFELPEVSARFNPSPQERAHIRAQCEAITNPDL